MDNLRNYPVKNKKGNEIGYVYYHKQFRWWGYFSYLQDDGCEGHDSKKEAISELKTAHKAGVKEVLEEIKYLQKEIEPWL